MPEKQSLPEELQQFASLEPMIARDDSHRVYGVNEAGKKQQISGDAVLHAYGYGTRSVENKLLKNPEQLVLEFTEPAATENLETTQPASSTDVAPEASPNQHETPAAPIALPAPEAKDRKMLSDRQYNDAREKLAKAVSNGDVKAFEQAALDIESEMHARDLHAGDSELKKYNHVRQQIANMREGMKARHEPAAWKKTRKSYEDMWRERLHDDLIGQGYEDNERTAQSVETLLSTEMAHFDEENAVDPRDDEDTFGIFNEQTGEWQVSSDFDPFASAPNAEDLEVESYLDPNGKPLIGAKELKEERFRLIKEGNTDVAQWGQLFIVTKHAMESAFLAHYKDVLNNGTQEEKDALLKDLEARTEKMRKTFNKDYRIANEYKENPNGVPIAVVASEQTEKKSTQEKKKRGKIAAIGLGILAAAGLGAWALSEISDDNDSRSVAPVVTEAPSSDEIDDVLGGADETATTEPETSEAPDDEADDQPGTTIHDEIGDVLGGDPDDLGAEGTQDTDDNEEADSDTGAEEDESSEDTDDEEADDTAADDDESSEDGQEADEDEQADAADPEDSTDDSDRQEADPTVNGAVDFEVEAGSGLINEIRDFAEANNLEVSDEQALALYEAGLEQFGKDGLITGGTYEISPGNIGISKPGEASWTPEFLQFMLDRLSPAGEKPGLPETG